MIEDIYYFIWHKYDRLRRIIKGLIRKSNYLRTGLPIDSWYDKDYLIPDALFCAVDDFVSKKGEDAFSVINWDFTEHHQLAKAKMIRILHWYNIERPSIEAKIDYMMEVLFSEPILFDENNMVLVKDRTEEESRMIKELYNVELELDRKNKYYSKMVCSLIGYLWC